MKIRILFFLGVALVTVLISFQQGFLFETLHSKMKSFGLNYKNSSESISFPFSYVAKDVQIRSDKIPYPVFLKELSLSPLLVATGSSENGELSLEGSLFSPKYVSISARDFGLSSALPKLFTKGELSGDLQGNLDKELKGAIELKDVSAVHPMIPKGTILKSATFDLRASKSLVSINKLIASSTLGDASGWLQINPETNELNGKIEVVKVDSLYAGILASMARGKQSERYELLFKFSKRGDNSFKVTPK